MIPSTIAEASPLDPLILLPLPDRLPQSPASTGQLDALVSSLSEHLTTNHGDRNIPLPVISAGMRGATRNAQVLMNAARVGAAEARAHLDQVDVGLRTVEYELARVRDEMARCMEYEPMYESMEMPEEDAFLASASAEVIDGLPTELEARKYALIIARLEVELAAVMEREEQLAALTKERDSLIRAKREVKAKFDAVDVLLVDFAKTSNAMASKIKDVTKTPSAAAAAKVTAAPAEAASEATSPAAVAA